MRASPFTFVLIFLTAALVALFAYTAGARTWTSSSGQPLEAEFISATADSVKLKRTSDNKEFTLPLSRLSAADQAWIKENAAKPGQGAPSPAPSADAPAKPITGPYAKLITGEWALAEHDDLPYAFYASKELSADKKYPLLLTLHGKSKNNENSKQIGFARNFAKPENYGKYPCFILAPLCYQPYGNAENGGWSGKPGEETINLIEELIDNLPIDPERVYCVGYSMGGYGTTWIMSEESKTFTAGVAIAGCSLSHAAALKRHPMWLFHAADDPVVPVEGSRNLADALKRSKVFKYTEFPDGGHGIVGKVTQDPEVHQWLFEQKK